MAISHTTAAISAFILALIVRHTPLPDLLNPLQWATTPWPPSSPQASTKANCTISHMTRYSPAAPRVFLPQKSPVLSSFSADPDWEKPRIDTLNSTAGEQWEFDGISADGTRSFIFGFSRDPNWAFIGTGNLRVYAEFAFRNGSRYAIVDYAEESTVESCLQVDGSESRASYTRGVWKGPGFLYSFEISGDMSRAVVTMENPEAAVTVHMNSIAPPRDARNKNSWVLGSSPSGEKIDPVTTMVVPYFHWVEPIPAADVTVEGVIRGGQIRWESGGISGHERLWHAFNWPTCLTGMLAVRLRAGPYALSLVDFTSSAMTGQLRAPAVVLVENGRQIFASRREGTEAGMDSPKQPSMGNDDIDDYMHIRKLYASESEGVTTYRLSDRANGVEITLVSPSRNKRWKFEITHRNIAFEYVLTNGSGGTGYSGHAEGGLVLENGEWEKPEESGPAFVEIMRFPEKSWLITGNYAE